jgi:D-alanyl-D-alanine carboxypeptidase (penicillin-binding protein 5/6)
VGEAAVQLGGESKVGLIAPRNLAITLPAGLNSGNIRVKIVYNGPIKAPIKKGQHIADLVVVTDTGPQAMPLVAEADVGAAGFFGRIWAGLAHLFA